MRPFNLEYKSLREILLNHELASLGDSYVNFLYSLAMSKRRGQPVGIKVSSRILAEALKRAGLRTLLPRRTDRHTQADAVEALVVYAWVEDVVNIQEGVSLLMDYEDAVEAFSTLLSTIARKMKLRGRTSVT
jgi:hypothetical protein